MIDIISNLKKSSIIQIFKRSCTITWLILFPNPSDNAALYLFATQ